MDHIDFQQLKSGEVNLGVRSVLISIGMPIFKLVVDINYGCPIRQGRRYWRRQSYNHRKLHSKIAALYRKFLDEHRALQANRVTDKLTHVHDRVYCCRSGSAADTQAIADMVTYYMQVYTYVIS
jgi:hypothetical protein